MQPIAVCEVKHGALEGLVRSLRESHSKAEDDRKGDLARIHAKLDEFGQRPTFAYMLLVSTCFAIIGAETAWLIHLIAGK